jgi:hypothetical protein
MLVAFYKGKNFWSKLIKFWTKSEYTHCEIIFSDGIWFGNSRGWASNVSFHSYTDLKNWDFLEFNIDHHTEQKIKKWCEEQDGKKYDWVGFYLSQVISLKGDSPDKWFCSEICTAALQRAGVFPYIKPSSISPGKLYKMISNLIRRKNDSYHRVQFK